MHGAVMAELKSFATAALPTAAWSTVCDAAGVADQVFVPITTYPDADAVALIGALAEELGLEPAALLEEFGDHLAEALLERYRSLVASEWGALDVLEHVEETIHQVIRLRDPEMDPPRLEALRSKETEVTITYTSPKRLCHLAIGLVRGVARVYGEEVSVTQDECMHTGGSRCVISVVRG